MSGIPIKQENIRLACETGMHKEIEKYTLSSDDKEGRSYSWNFKGEKKNTLNRHIGGFTSDMGRHEQILAMHRSFMRWDCKLPVNFLPTSNINRADFVVRFVKGTSRILPIPFDKGVLAYAFFPWTSRKGEIWMNDDLDWSLYGLDSGIETQDVLTHEIGHSQDEKHNTVEENSIMQPNYVKGSGRIITDHDAAVVTNAYKKGGLIVL